GAAGHQHVIDQHDVDAVDREVNLGGPHHGLGAGAGKVIAVERDVQRPDVIRFQPLRQPLGEHVTPAADADDRPRPALLRRENIRRDQPGEAVDQRRDLLLLGDDAHGGDGSRKRNPLPARYSEHPGEGGRYSGRVRGRQTATGRVGEHNHSTPGVPSPGSFDPPCNQIPCSPPSPGRDEYIAGRGYHYTASTKIFAAAAAPMVNEPVSERSVTASALASRCLTSTGVPGVRPWRSANWRKAASWSSTRAIRSGRPMSQVARLARRWPPLDLPA